MIDFVAWLIVGVMAGWVVSSLMGRRESRLLSIIVGIVGAFVAGIVVAPLLGISTINQNSFSPPAMLVSVGGAVVLLGVLSLFLHHEALR